MPSFRNLKGEPVEDVVDSRALPGLPDPGQALVERETVRAAVEKIATSKPARAREAVEPDAPPGEATDWDVAMGDLNASLGRMHAQMDTVQQTLVEIEASMATVRASAASNLAKLRKVQELLKVLD